MCTARSEDEVAVCSCAAQPITERMASVAGVECQPAPATGEVVVINTDPARRAEFHRAIEETVAPYRSSGAC